jgi:hypothetical protein
MNTPDTRDYSTLPPDHLGEILPRVAAFEAAIAAAEEVVSADLVAHMIVARVSLNGALQAALGEDWIMDETFEDLYTRAIALTDPKKQQATRSTRARLARGRLGESNGRPVTIRTS